MPTPEQILADLGRIANEWKTVAVLWHAPTGLVTCPTLLIVIGTSLVVTSLSSWAWSFLAGVCGLFYGLFGAVRLGVAIDWVLVAGGASITVLGFQNKRRQEQKSCYGV